MSVKNFRIKEYCGNFTFERLYKQEVTTGFFWWRKSKIVEEWYPMKYIKFKNLDDAKDYLELLKKGTKYHYL
jgi:hypothetical protein